MKRLLWIAPIVLALGCGKAPAPQQAQQPGPPASPSLAAEGARPSALAAPVASAAVIPSGTHLRVRLAQTVDTERSRSGDRFSATLDEPIVLNGQTVVPKGASVSGHVTSSRSSGRLRGRAVLALQLDTLHVNGKNYPIQTASISRVSASHKRRNFALIGGGSGLGAAIGAIAGGGKGALIGAAAGGAAGTAGAAATGKRNVALAVETPLTFSLRAPVQL